MKYIGLVEEDDSDFGPLPPPPPPPPLPVLDEGDDFCCFAGFFFDCSEGEVGEDDC